MAGDLATRPAHLLAGLDLPGGWSVESMIPRGTDATGGHFSASYFVRDASGSRAFLKAIDYVEALQSNDPPARLAALTNAFNFERDLVQRCMADGMKHVVRAIHDGGIAVPNAGPIPQVNYLIFELADGDIRRYRALAGALHVAWVLRSLHQVALGIKELHAAGIAHQDLKPSNVLTFGDDLCKLADLGRASVRGGDSPFDHLAFAGDLTYSPPEALYGFSLPDWNDRRKAADLYALGSLLLFQFTSANATGALIASLEPVHRPRISGGTWDGAYDDVVLYLRDALGDVAAQIPNLSDDAIRSGVIGRFLELCEPDPRRRGHPKNHAMRHGDPYSVERYVSYFHALAARAERTLALATST